MYLQTLSGFGERHIADKALLATWVNPLVQEGYQYGPTTSKTSNSKTTAVRTTTDLP